MAINITAIRNFRHKQRFSKAMDKYLLQDNNRTLNLDILVSNFNEKFKTNYIKKQIYQRRWRLINY